MRACSRALCGSRPSRRSLGRCVAGAHSRAESVVLGWTSGIRSVFRGWSERAGPHPGRAARCWCCVARGVKEGVVRRDHEATTAALVCRTLRERDVGWLVSLHAGSPPSLRNSPSLAGHLSPLRQSGAGSRERVWYCMYFTHATAHGLSFQRYFGQIERYYRQHSAKSLLKSSLNLLGA